MRKQDDDPNEEAKNVDASFDGIRRVVAEVNDSDNVF